MRITITQEDIARGVRGAEDNCPITLPAMRATGSHYAYTDAGIASLPPKAQRFVRLFDCGK